LTTKKAAPARAPARAAPKSTPTLTAAAKAFTAAARSSSTLALYRGDWNRFHLWCAGRGLQWLPAEEETVRLYLTDLALEKKKVATIERAFAALCHNHVEAGHASPRRSELLKTTRKGIRRRLSTAQRQVRPMLPAEMRNAIKTARSTKDRPANAVLRDRALLLLGFACGNRRTELVGIDIDDVAFTDEGLRVLLKRSKTDQEGAGRPLGVPRGGNEVTCPERAVRAWLEALEAAGEVSGPLFRRVRKNGLIGRERLTDGAVALIVKRAASEAGLDPTNYSGHSLRAGLVTAAAKAGKSFASIMKQTGHRSTAMVARYAREAELFIDNAAEGVGL
jgi:site-specific recombinase XerD